MTEQEAYRILEISQDATIRQIKQAYKKQRKRCRLPCEQDIILVEGAHNVLIEEKIYSPLWKLWDKIVYVGFIVWAILASLATLAMACFLISVFIKSIPSSSIETIIVSGLFSILFTAIFIYFIYLLCGKRR